MEIDYSKYEPVIGLEIHAQMLTKSKAFCSDSTEYGSSPNTQVSSISLGHPGTLHFHNKEAVKYVVRLGIACNCNISEHNYYARKNYFYADLPKGYQITQDKTPICENGEKIYQETRTFDALKGTKFVMRTKEGASDYRYFPKPDLPPLHISQQFIDGVKAQMPALPKELFIKYTKTFLLSEYDANVLTENKNIAEYFEEILKHTGNIKSAANWVIVQIKGYLNEQAIHISDFVLQPSKIAEIISLIDSNKISNSAATQNLFPAMINEHHKSALEIAESLNLLQNNNSEDLQKHVDVAIAKFLEKVAEYKTGKVSLIGLFMGEVMKLSKGKADPKLANQLVKQTLDKI